MHAKDRTTTDEMTRSIDTKTEILTKELPHVGLLPFGGGKEWRPGRGALGAYLVLDDLTVNEISDELLGVADQPDCHRLLLDFRGVAQLSSAMLARLVTLHRKMQSKGEKLRLCGISSHLRSIFATTRLDRLFDILDTESGTVT